MIPHVLGVVKRQLGNQHVLKYVLDCAFKHFAVGFVAPAQP